MAPIVTSIEIARPQNDVFAYVTDPSRFAEWQAGVVGGMSAEYTLKVAKLASARYLDTLPTSGSELGHAFRDTDLEQQVLALTRQFGIGAQFGGRYFCHDVRVVRLPRHGASCPVAIAVSCSADRQALGKITADGVFLERLETDPARFLPDVELDAGEAVHGGWCVARQDDGAGSVVFLRHALPGERVRAVITQTTSKFARADAVEIIRAGPDRVQPPEQVPQAAGRADDTSVGDRQADPPRGFEARWTHSDQGQQPGRSGGNRCALSSFSGGREDRPHRARHMLPETWLAGAL